MRTCVLGRGAQDSDHRFRRESDPRGLGRTGPADRRVARRRPAPFAGGSVGVRLARIATVSGFALIVWNALVLLVEVAE